MNVSVLRACDNVVRVFACTRRRQDARRLDRRFRYRYGNGLPDDAAWVVADDQRHVLTRHVKRCQVDVNRVLVPARATRPAVVGDAVEPGRLVGRAQLQPGREAQFYSCCHYVYRVSVQKTVAERMQCPALSSIIVVRSPRHRRPRNHKRKRLDRRGRGWSAFQRRRDGGDGVLVVKLFDRPALFDGPRFQFGERSAASLRISAMRFRSMRSLCSSVTTSAYSFILMSFCTLTAS